MKKPEDNAFGLAIKEIRKLKGLTQSECATSLKVTQSQWSSYEVGSSRATLDVVCAMSDLFEIHPLILIGKFLEYLKYPKDKSYHLSIEEWETVVQHIDGFRKNRLTLKAEAMVGQLTQTSTNSITLKDLNDFVTQNKIDPVNVIINSFAVK